MEIKVRFCVCFRRDGLDVEAVRETLNGLTDAKVELEDDSVVEYVDKNGNEVAETVHIFLMEGSLFSCTMVKLKLNCDTLADHPDFGDDGRYILFPR